MAFFEDDDRYSEDNNYGDSGMSGAVLLKIIGFFFTALFAPTAAIGVLIFFIFLRTLRWKPHVTFVPVFAMFTLLAVFSGGPLSYLSIDSIRNETGAAALSYLYLSTMLGLILGFALILYKVYELKRRPEYKHVRGWAYGFEYAQTPIEKMIKKRNMKSLIEGEQFDYEKAPIGVIETPVIAGNRERTLDMKNYDRSSIVYRYYSEALAHTLITGKTGSGKALHIDTEIRSKEKGWTTVGEIEIGDTIYDESGNHTVVEAIYQPMTEDHYEITFDNGEVVKACGDHLWNIGDVREGNTFNTRDLLKNYSADTDYEIRHSIDGLPYTHKILKIKKIQDEPEDYLCFTVDSDSHLFLITRSYIPTHNTVTMLSLIQNDILAGNPVCVIDFKKSPDLIYFLSKWAKEEGREFHHFTNGRPGTYNNPYKDDQSTYDPLATGESTAKADMILNLRSWDSASEVFKKRTQDVLQSLFFLLARTEEQHKDKVPGIDWDNGGLAQFVSALELNNFRAMIELMAKDMQAGSLSAGNQRRYKTLVELYKELSAKGKSDLKAQILELLSIARTLIVSNYGDWLASGASKYHIDLMSIATNEKAPVVLFSFNQQEEPEFAKYIGSIVMSDLSRVSALKNRSSANTKFGVYIDEFQTLDPITVKDNLEKARGSKMYITLSLQSIDQIISSAANQGEAIASAIIDTCANFIFHDGSGYDTAEKMSKIIGKASRYVYRTTSKSSNRLLNYRLMTVESAMVSKDEEIDWIVPPSEFQSLESPIQANGYKATAYIINKAPEDKRFKRSGGGLARKVHVVVAEETSKGIPKGFKSKVLSSSEPVDFDELQSKVENEQSAKFNVPASKPVNQENLHSGGWEIIDEEPLEELNDNETLNTVENNDVDNSKVNSENIGLPDIPDLLDADEKTSKSDMSNSTGPVGSPLKKETSQLDNFKNIKNNTKQVKKSDSVKKNTVKSKDNNDGFTLPKLD